MAASSYDEALRRLLVHEGGYSNHPSDPGGPTNWGITIHDYRKYVKPNATAADVRGMPVEVAKRIYRSKYWNAMRCDELPAGVDYAVFDYGVNSGIGRAGKVLRRLVGLAGNSGAVTDEVIAAVRRRQPRPLVEAICDERLAFLRRLRTWPVFGNGWGRRVREVRAAALAMAGKSGHPADHVGEDPGADGKSAGGKPPPKPAPKPAPGAPAKGRTPPVPAAKKFGIGAAVVAAVAALAQWAGDHPILTGGAVVLAALGVLVVVRRLGKGD
jgi:lysozyme family protein